MTLDADLSAAYLDVLGLPPGSTASQIHAQYRRLAKLYHPDRNPQRRAWSEERLRLLNEAYRALAHAAPPPPAAEPAPRADAALPPAAPGRGARRVLRGAALVCVVCVGSIAYADWSQSSLLPLALPTSAPLPVSALPAPPPAGALSRLPSADPGSVPPSAPADPGAVPPLAPADPGAVPPPPAGAQPFALLPVPTALPAADSPAEAGPDGLAAQFKAQLPALRATVLRATQIVARADAQTQHAPQSLRPRKAEQLAADTLELSRLRQSVADSFADLRLPGTRDLRRMQVADLRLALSQLQRQQRLVDAQAASFPAR